MKLDFLKKKNNLKRKDFSFNPALYWEIIFFIGFILVVLASFSGYQLFLDINQESVPQTASTSSKISTVDLGRVNKVLNYFTIREQRSQEILNSPSAVVDPTL